MYAILLGIVELGLRIWKKRWVAVGIVVFWLLFHYHAFAGLVPLAKSWHYPTDVSLAIILAAAGGVVIGSLFTALIMVGVRDSKKKDYDKKDYEYSGY